MTCIRCGGKEHTCTACDLTPEQKFYLYHLRTCSDCYDDEGKAKWAEHKNADGVHEND